MTTPIPSVDLRPDHWAIVRDALRRHVPQREVVAFGSRATWTAKDYSDLDLAVMGEEPLSLRTASALDEALGDSDLPFKVDVLDWARIDDGFRSIIRRHGVPVQTPPATSDTARAAPLSCLADIVDLTLSNVDKKTKPGERPVRLCNYMDVQNNTFITDQLDFMAATATDREVARCGLARGDVIITKDLEKYGDIGVPALVRHNIADLVCGYHLAILRPRPAQVVGDYLVYALSATQVQHQFHAYANGVTRFGLRKGDIGLVEVPLPSLPEQRAIAHVLGTLDDKIELNRRMNETLEAMARALFKSWFVDFGPVRAKMEGRDTGLPQDIAHLFPDRLVDSELGEIPEGWEAKSLKDCMNLTMGQSPPGSAYNEHGDGLPFFQGRSDFGFRYPRKRRFCSAPTRVAHPEDTLVSVRAPVGDINLAWERCCIGRGVAALRHKSGSSSFTYHLAWALQRELKEYEHTGTVFGAINKGQFQALKVTEPDPRVVEAFETMSINLDARVRSNTAESRTLAALRDTLLAKLISGEIRVPDAERSVESAT